MSDDDTFARDLEDLGFALAQDRGGGVLQYSRRQSRYLTFWVHWSLKDDNVLFTWEHSIGEYVDATGMQIGANEPLNTFLFPKYDARGPVDIRFVAQEMDRVERILRGVNLLDGAT
jgi:hypothetical protein